MQSVTGKPIGNLLERFMALVTEVHQIRDDLNGTVRRLDLLQTTLGPSYTSMTVAVRSLEFWAPWVVLAAVLCP